MSSLPKAFREDGTIEGKFQVMIPGFSAGVSIDGYDHASYFTESGATFVKIYNGGDKRIFVCSGPSDWNGMPLLPGMFDFYGLNSDGQIWFNNQNNQTQYVYVMEAG